MSTTTTAPARINGKPDPVTTLRDMLSRSQKQIAAALPKHMGADHMIRVAITAVQTTPALLECSPLSIVGGVMRAAELGLELSGPLGQAYLVPRWNGKTKQNEASFQIGYRGLIDLTYRSGFSQSVQSRVVYQGDEFSYRLGTRPRIYHIPTEKPGPWTHVYAVLFLKGGEDFEVMSKEAVFAHAWRYSDGFKKKTNYSPWTTAEEAMAMKTAIRRLLKRAPVSIEVRRAMAADEQVEELDDGMVVEAGGTRSDILAAALAGDQENQAAAAPSDEQLHDQRVPGGDGD